MCISFHTLTYNMRYPGQYYDSETGLSYNYYRDYDPALGRYVQSDPIGLKGGVNTYGYVGQNPIWAVDPLGLTATSSSSPPSSTDQNWLRYPNRGGEVIFHCGYKCYLEKRQCTGQSCVKDPLGEACYDESSCIVDNKHKYKDCQGTPDQYPQSDMWNHFAHDDGGIWKKGWPAFLDSRRHDFYESK